MGVMTRTALLAAIAASVMLAILSLQTWAHLWASADLIGEVPAGTAKGTDVYGVANIGDGTVVLLGSLMTLSLAVLAMFSESTRRLAGACIGLSGLGMFGIAAYDCIHLGNPPVAAGSHLASYHLTIVPYFAAASALVVAVAGAVATEIHRLPRFRLGARGGMSTTSRLGLWLVVVAGLLLAVCGAAPWFNFGYIELRGQQTHVMSTIGDGYLLSALGVACVAAAAWLLGRGRLNLAALLLLFVSSGAAFGVAASSLTYQGNVCQDSTFLGFMSGPTCAYQSGDVISSFGEGSATSFLWAATALALIIVITALSLPLLENNRRDDQRWGNERWA
jgi:hypothetical protein